MSFRRKYTNAFTQRSKALIRCSFQHQRMYSNRKNSEHIVLQGVPKLNLPVHQKKLNSLLHTTRNALELHRLIHSNQHIMNYINVSTAAKTAAHIINSPENIKSTEQCDLLIEIFETLLKLIEEHTYFMGTQAVGNCLWSIGKLCDVFDVDVQDPKFKRVYNRLCSKAGVLYRQMNTQEISNVLWSLGKTKWKNKELFYQVVYCCFYLDGEQFKAQEISNIIWACAQSKYTKVKHIQFFVEIARKKLNKMKEQEISIFLWGLSQMRFYDKQIGKQVEQIITQKHYNFQFKSQEVSNLALGFSELGLENKDFILSFLTRQILQSNSREIQDYTNFIYALSIFRFKSNIVQMVVDKIVQLFNQDSSQFSTLDFRQLRQVQQIYFSEGQNLILPENLEQICIKEKQQQAQFYQKMPNSFLDKVYSFVKLNFGNAVRRPLILNDEFEIHIQIVYGKQKIAVQILCVKTFQVSQPHNVLQSTQSFYKMLENFGWKVVQVSTFQWDDNDYKIDVINRINTALLS